MLLSIGRPGIGGWVIVLQHGQTSLRRIVRMTLAYTTNAIESLNMQLRKIIKTRGHFPNDEAAISCSGWHCATCLQSLCATPMTGSPR
jgi:hypothetical protein